MSFLWEIEALKECFSFCHTVLINCWKLLDFWAETVVWGSLSPTEEDREDLKARTTKLLCFYFIYEKREEERIKPTSTNFRAISGHSHLFYFSEKWFRSRIDLLEMIFNTKSKKRRCNNEEKGTSPFLPTFEHFEGMRNHPCRRFSLSTLSRRLIGSLWVSLSRVFVWLYVHKYIPPSPFKCNHHILREREREKGLWDNEIPSHNDLLPACCFLVDTLLHFHPLFVNTLTQIPIDESFFFRSCVSSLPPPFNVPPQGIREQKLVYPSEIWKLPLKYMGIFIVYIIFLYRPSLPFCK